MNPISIPMSDLQMTNILFSKGNKGGAKIVLVLSTTP
jgi:hypothetical protein